MKLLRNITENSEAGVIEEILYAQQLGGNNQNERSKAVENVSHYFHLKSSGQGLSEDDLMKIWKGLYYCMYMADKPLFQENVADDISNLIHSFGNMEQRLLYFKTAMKTFAREWMAMDNFRADKFMMLMRRVLRQAFICLRQNSWSEKDVKITVKILEDSIILPSDNTNSVPLGIKYHLVDVILEELAKIGGKNLPHSLILSFIYPYMKVMTLSRQKAYVGHVKTNIFEGLIKQSKLGVEHEEDLDYGEYEQKLADSDEELDEDVEDMELEGKELDPRAGGVDVFLPTLKPDFEKIAFALQEIGSLKEVNAKKRKMIYSLSKDFKKAHSGQYPYQPPTLTMEKRPFSVPMIKDAIKRVKFHEQEMKKSEDPEMMGKNRKAKLALLKHLLPDDTIHGAPPMPPIDNEAPIKPRKYKRKNKNMKNIDNFDAEPKLKKKNSSCLTLDTNIEKAVTKNLQNMANTIGLPESVISIPTSIKKKVKKGNNFFCELTEKDFLPESENREENENVSGPKEKVVGKKMKRSNKNKVDSKSKQKLKESNVMDEKNDTSKNLKKKKSMEKSTKADINVPETPNNKLLKQKKSSKNKKQNNKLKSPNKSSKVTECIKKVSDAPTPVDPWLEPLKDGEFEFDVESIKSTKKKMKTKKDKMRTIKKNPKISKVATTPDNMRKLKINLLKNKEHELLDYRRVLQDSPGIPYSAEKKPRVSALKPTDSPILIKKSFKLKRLR